MQTPQERLESCGMNSLSTVRRRWNFPQSFFLQRTLYRRPRLLALKIDRQRNGERKAILTSPYVQPSRRPKDGRYGENPNRLQHFYQFQVILKPSPQDLQWLYLASLEAIGVDLHLHDVRFVEDDWESPTLGAWGLVVRWHGGFSLHLSSARRGN